jgi:hypothetical protein
MDSHDRATQEILGMRVASLLGVPFVGQHRPGAATDGLYFVPADTLSGETAAQLGITHDQQLYGGVAPYPHVATKAISHGLVAGGASAPSGWSLPLGKILEEVVPKGFTAFDLADVVTAGTLLLGWGPVRLKEVLGTGGRGQSVARSVDELMTTLSALDASAIAAHGLVLEEHLDDVVTYSVGVTCLGTHRIAYWGTQRLTRSNHGLEVYGGSDLQVVRGGFEALLALDLDVAVRKAVRQAQRYDGAAFRAYPGLFASRRNYDIIQGTDAGGVARSGVLEQSWRAGGASGAEIAALEAFARDPNLTQVRSSTVEIFGESAPPPKGATVYYRGTDPAVGPLTKYAVAGR